MRKIKNSNNILLNILYELEADPEMVTSIHSYVELMKNISDYAGCEDLPKDFSAFSYLLCNLDIYEENIDPWGHYLHSGLAEGRQY